MAFIQKNDEEEKNAGNTNQVLQPSGGAQPTTGGGGTGGAASAAPAAGAQPQGFAGIMDYLGANKDQAPGMANTISENLGNEYNSEKGTIDTAANNATGDINKSTINYDPAAVSGALKDPASYVKDPNNISAFTGMRDAAYKGPGSFEDTSYYGGAAAAANKGDQLSQSGKTPGGYGELLNRIQPNPTPGKSALDIGILQSNPDAQKTISDALAPFAGIKGYLGGKATDIDTNLIPGAKSTTDNTSKQTKSAISDAETGFKSSISDKLSKAQSGAAANDTAAKGFLANPTAADPAAAAKAFGISTDDWTKLVRDLQVSNQGFGVGTPGGIAAQPLDLSKYYHGANPATDYNPDNVSSADDFARSAALSKLGGDDSILSQDLVDQAGTAPAAGSFDFSKEQSDIAPYYASINAELQRREASHPNLTPVTQPQPVNPGDPVPSVNPGINPPAPVDRGVLTTPETSGAAAVQKSIADEKARNKAAGTTGPTFGFKSSKTPGIF